MHQHQWQCLPDQVVRMSRCMQANQGLGPGSAEEIVAYHKPSNIEMPRRLLRCLRGLDWLNDEVINMYMGLLQVCTRLICPALTHFAALPGLAERL